MDDDSTLICSINASEPKKSLPGRFDDLFQKIKAEYGDKYDVTQGEPSSDDGSWSAEIKIRQGAKIGAGIEVKWSESSPSQLHVDIDESSKLGTTLLMASILGFALIGGIWARADIPPLDMLPGRKLSVAIGVMLGLFPGAICYLILKTLLMGSSKDKNTQLVAQVRMSVRSFIDSD